MQYGTYSMRNPDLRRTHVDHEVFFCYKYLACIFNVPDPYYMFYPDPDFFAGGNFVPLSRIQCQDGEVLTNTLWLAASSPTLRYRRSPLQSISSANYFPNCSNYRYRPVLWYGTVPVPAPVLSLWLLGISPTLMKVPCPHQQSCWYGLLELDLFVLYGSGNFSPDSDLDPTLVGRYLPLVELF